MDCAEAKLRIEPYVSGQLDAEQKGALESHLSSCAECRLDSELTRASKSAPTAQPLAPPAPPPEVPSASDWTIDSIFGAPASRTAPVEAAAAPPPPPEAEFGVPPSFASSTREDSGYDPAPAPEGAAAPEPEPAPEAEPEHEPEPAPEPEPEVALPDMLDGPDPGPAPRGSGDGTSGRPGWDFEPADQKEDAVPPEGSLFFAEEALARSGDGRSKGKSSFARVALWSLGGIVGLGLLGVSVWLALAVREESPPFGRASQGETRPEAAPPAPAGEALAPGENPVEPAALPEAAGVPEGSGTAEPSVAETPAHSATSEPEKPPAARSATPRTASAPPNAAAATPKTAATPPKKAPAPAVTGAGAASHRDASSAAAARTARELASLPTPWRNPPPRPQPVVPSPAEEDDELEFPEDPEPAPRAEQPAAKAPGVQAPKDAEPAPSKTTVLEPAKATEPAPAKPEPAKATEPEPAKPEPAPAPADESAQRPIDRLHLATLAAEQSADVPALRKLRDTWRGLVKSSVGPDRARAKRELADCLWAIQTLTTRTSDQKAALAAYRDYVLNAPAGGADPRTVARMRQLEDALAESR